jgi:predicted nucleotidyltransferase
MDARSVMARLQSELATLKTRFRVKSLGVFGSIVRGEDSPGSDIDILVEFEVPSFDHYMELKFYLEDLFGRSVDLVLKGSLKPALRDRILQEVRDVA